MYTITEYLTTDQGKMSRIIAQDNNLKVVLSEAKGYVSTKWKIIIEVRNNNISPCKVYASNVRQREVFLVHNFSRKLFVRYTKD